MKGLSKAQQNVIEKMREGWELGSSHAWGMHCWLQRGGIGCGGESQEFAPSTLNVLFTKGLIKQKGREHGIMVFELREEDSKVRNK